MKHQSQMQKKQLLQEETDFNDNDVNNLTPAALSYLRYLVNMEKLNMYWGYVSRSVQLTNKPAATAKQTAQEAEDSQEVDASKNIKNTTRQLMAR